MTNQNEDLVVDTDGIPILTNRVHEDDAPPPTNSLEPDKDDVSVEEITKLLLNSDTFSRQLDAIAAELTRAIQKEMEQTLQPILEEAISLAFDDSNTASCAAVRKKLEATLPDLLARTLQE